jgi:hypothetical protein
MTSLFEIDLAKTASISSLLLTNDIPPPYVTMPTSAPGGSEITPLGDINDVGILKVTPAFYNGAGDVVGVLCYYGAHVLSATETCEDGNSDKTKGASQTCLRFLAKPSRGGVGQLRWSAPLFGWGEYASYLICLGHWPQYYENIDFFTFPTTAGSGGSCFFFVVEKSKSIFGGAADFDGDAGPVTIDCRYSPSASLISIFSSAPDGEINMHSIESLPFRFIVTVGKSLIVIAQVDALSTCDGTIRDVWHVSLDVASIPETFFPNIQIINSVNKDVFTVLQFIDTKSGIEEATVKSGVVAKTGVGIDANALKGPYAVSDFYATRDGGQVFVAYTYPPDHEIRFFYRIGGELAKEASTTDHYIAGSYYKFSSQPSQILGRNRYLSFRKSRTVVGTPLTCIGSIGISSDPFVTVDVRIPPPSLYVASSGRERTITDLSSELKFPKDLVPQAAKPAVGILSSSQGSYWSKDGLILTTLEVDDAPGRYGLVFFKYSKKVFENYFSEILSVIEAQ